ncbi:MAG: nuclear transport factor 2 family protein [Alphaproteobacteria bacterium]|nr:nuclear transport factor 2 family protein [Alphaproteobacteria bacterium]
MTPLDTVLAFLNAMEKMDYATALALIAPDCEYTNLPMGTVRGPEGVRSVLEPFFDPILENEFRLLRTAADGPVVFVERLDRHRSATGWFELPVTGVMEVQNGKITVWREYFDLATMMKGAGQA